MVALAEGDPAPQSISLVAGLALIEAVDIAVPNQPLMLKWPNDLMLGTAKLAGILLERSGDRVVVGFGLNLSSAPKLEGRDAAALNGVLLPQAFAPLLAGSFARMLSLWRSSDPEAFARAWLARAHPVVSPVEEAHCLAQVHSEAYLHDALGIGQHALDHAVELEELQTAGAAEHLEQPRIDAWRIHAAFL